MLSLMVAITTLLVAAMFVLYFLEEPSKTPKTMAVNANVLKTLKSQATTKILRKKLVGAEASKEPQLQTCPHHLGYLKENAKYKQVPNECLSCPKILECLGI